jgi:hypothetical protein
LVSRHYGGLVDYTLGEEHRCEQELWY